MLQDKQDIIESSENTNAQVTVKIVTPSRLLLERLRSIAFCVSKDRSLPNLQNVKIDVFGENVNLTTTDLHHTATIKLESKISGSVSVCVPFDLLFKLLTTLPEQLLSIFINSDTFQLSVEAESGTYEFLGQSSEQWPATPKMDNGLKLKVETGLFVKALAEVLPFIINDDLRPALEGIYIGINSSELVLCTTDTLALCIRKIPCVCKIDNQKSSFIISSKIAKALSNIDKEKSDGDLELEFSDSFLTISGLPNDLFFTSQLIDGRFLDFSDKIPLGNPNRLIVNRNTFLTSINRIEPFTNSGTKRIRLELSAGNQVRLIAEDFDNGKQAWETIPGNYSGKDLQIGYSLNHLKHALGSWNVDEVRFELSTPSQSGVIRDSVAFENDSNLVLIMPYLLD